MSDATKRAAYLLRRAADLMELLGMNSVQFEFDGQEQDVYWLEQACRETADELDPKA